MPSPLTAPLSAPALLREVGLMPDGPVPWGRPVAARGSGVFVVELPAPIPTAPIELTRVGKWVERVPTLRLDGERPSSRALAARLASFWLPTEVILYVGATEGSIGARVAALRRTVLGDRWPHSGGHWLHVLTALPTTRIWWAQTDAVEEYEDALLGAFAAEVGSWRGRLASSGPGGGAASGGSGGGAGAASGGGVPLVGGAASGGGVPSVSGATSGAHHPLEAVGGAALGGGVDLPFANLRRPTGERRSTGLTGSILAEPAEPAAPTRRVVVLPDGDAEGANGEPPARRTRVGGSGAAAGGGRAAAAGGASPASGSRRSSTRRSGPAGGSQAAGAPSATLTAQGAERLRAELTQLVEVRRPQVVARIRSAKELGDLRENADYHAAREEQSFLEGRIQSLEARLRDAVIATVPSAGAGADLGSTVTVEIDGSTITYTLVGTAEADPSAGRVSVMSPVGKALVGATAGAEVVVQTPRGQVVYRIVAVG